MGKIKANLSTGIPTLDRVFRGVMNGDNIVWQVDSISEYTPFVTPFARYAQENRQRLVYFRYADHEPLLEAQPGIDICHLSPEKGFEPFLAEVHRVIDESGRGSLYVFDCLSQLAPEWCSDRMLGNFFMLTCPYLYDRAAIAYFAILRNRHSFHAMRPISATTQVLVDAYRHQDRIYIHPIKVQYRHSPTMYMLHAWEGDNFTPVTQSYIITEILKHVPWSRLDAASYMLGYWSRTFTEAESIQDDIDQGFKSPEVGDQHFRKILRMLVSHDEPVLRLAERYLCLRDLLNIRKRMIGTGLIGGKSVGMLLARAILRQKDPRWENLLEEHDSFYIGADVFYTYLVQNGCWWMTRKLMTSFDSEEDDTETVRRRILAGEFPDYIVKQFSDMLDYFGQSPIIVRSSSLLEDNFGNAFAGKYDSVFFANQGGPHKRLEDFLFAVRTVYASTMSEEALSYRFQRGLMKHDEQMALLIQRVSGATYGNLFYPQVAGVGFSFNPYVWHESIDPEAGILRVVFGLGTRAVERSDDDYTRIVALNAPERRPEGNINEVARCSQRRVDVLDLEANQLASLDFHDILAKRSADLPISMFASRNRSGDARDEAPRGASDDDLMLTFDRLLLKTNFVEDMREMLKALQEGYQYHLDIEFTLNFFESDKYRINLVQCRPQEAARISTTLQAFPEDVSVDDILIKASGSIIGESTRLDLDWLIYVVPSLYSELPMGDRYSVAHIIGSVANHQDLKTSKIMLLGPGRWGTKSPELGVPVAFADIRPAAVLCEIVAMREDLVPDVSLGTHFFNELVESGMLYIAVFPDRTEDQLNRPFFEDPALNRLSEFCDETSDISKVIRVIRCTGLVEAGAITLHADMLKQRALLYRRRE